VKKISNTSGNPGQGSNVYPFFIYRVSGTFFQNISDTFHLPLKSGKVVETQVCNIFK